MTSVENVVNLKATVVHLATNTEIIALEITLCSNVQEMAPHASGSMF